MSRVPRRFQYSESGCYHILNRGHNRETVFRDDSDFETFLSLLGRYRERFGFKLFHYCLMSNHFHLLLQLPKPRDLSPLMAGLLRSYVHHYHRRYQFVGHLWQGRFKSPAVQMEAYLSSCGRYIERNPLEAGIMEEPWEYRWSSCGHYALGEANELVTVNPYYTELAKRAPTRQKRWRSFLRKPDAKEETVAKETWALGDATFRQSQAVRNGRPTPGKRGRPRRDEIRT